jgi:antitoxin component HigA of HigAB toxin-antitoxin module
MEKYLRLCMPAIKIHNVTDLFKKHRKLTTGMIRKLHGQLRIPLDTQC